MSSKEYGFSSSIKREVEERAKEKGVNPKSVHHIFPRSLAKNYRLPKDKITSSLNAIALEQDFHDAIHNGGKFIDQETGEEIEIEAFSKDDYIFLAQAVLGFTEEDFEREYPRNTSKKRKRRKRRR